MRQSIINAMVHKKGAVLALVLCAGFNGFAQDVASNALVPHHPGQLLGRFALEPGEMDNALASTPEYKYLGLSRKERQQLKNDVSRIGTRDIGKGLNFYNADAESRFGREAAAEVEKNARLIDDPALNRYLEQLCQRLVTHSDATTPLRVKILRDDEINAFALPGGYLYVNSGLILAADNEAELAGVIGHEIAHVAARHATRNISRAQIWKIASLPLMYVGGVPGFLVQEATSIAVPLTFLKFSRDAEREADMLGVQYLYAAGYDPNAFITFFEKLNTTPPKHKLIAKAFATHPLSAERIERVQREIATLLPPSEQYVVTTSEFDEAKVRLAEMLGVRELQDTKPVLRRTSR